MTTREGGKVEPGGAAPAPIYVINLARRPDRLKQVTRQLDAAGLRFNRIDAIDAQSADPAWIDAQFATPGLFGALSSAEQACVLSHFTAYERFASSPATASHAVILEDDVRLSDQARSLLASPGWLPRTTRLLKIERACSDVLLGRARRVGGPDGPLISRLYSDHLCSAGYMISRPTAATLAAMRRKPTLMIDFLLFHPMYSPIFRWLRPEQLAPALVEQTTPNREDSDIHFTRTELDQLRVMKPRGRAKIWRETMRPYHQARLLAASVLDGARWRSIEPLPDDRSARRGRPEQTPVRTAAPAPP